MLTRGLLILLSAAILACGGTTSSTATSPREVGRPAAEVLDDMAAAIRAVHTYHLVADLAGGVHVDLRIGGASLLSGTLTMRGATADVVLDHGRVYLHGREFFRLTSGEVAANVVGDRWVLVPASTSGQLTGSLARFTDTSTLAHCLVSDPHGTLTTSTTTLGGREVVDVDDAGDEPGTAKGSLAVDAGSALPVQERLDGRPSPGGPPPDPACGSVSGVSSGGVVSFDSWGSPVSITPPPSPLDLSALGG